MSVYKNRSKYQLISPIVGTKIYQTSSPEKGARHCYDELKLISGVNALDFTMMNIDTFETYKYGIADKTNLGHVVDDHLPVLENVHGADFKTKLLKLEDRVGKIEREILHLQQQQQQQQYQGEHLKHAVHAEHVNVQQQQQQQYQSEHLKHVAHAEHLNVQQQPKQPSKPVSGFADELAVDANNNFEKSLQKFTQPKPVEVAACKQELDSCCIM